MLRNSWYIGLMDSLFLLTDLFENFILTTILTYLYLHKKVDYFIYFMFFNLGFLCVSLLCSSFYLLYLYFDVISIYNFLYFYFSPVFLIIVFIVYLVISFIPFTPPLLPINAIL